MCGKSSDTTQTTTTQLPPEMQKAYNSLIGQAQGIYNSTSYTPFSGGDTNSTINSGTQALQGAQGAYQPYFDQASSALTAAGTPAYQSVQNYENPYQSDVINATLANMKTLDQQQQQGVVGNAIMSGAMGGARVGVAQAQLAGQQALANNQTLAGLNSQNYAQALSAAQQQQQNQLGIAGAQAGMGTAASQNLVQSGMATTQAGEDQYNRDLALYQAQQSYPFEKASWLGNIVEGLGSTSGGTSTSTTSGGSTGSGILGGLLGGASLFMKSDERTKEDIQPIGKTFDGQMLYRFRYKGEPGTHVGMIAQEVEKRNPDAVRSHNDVKYVNYREATDKAAEKGHFATGGVVPYSGMPSFGGTQSGNAGAASSGLIPASAMGMGMGSGPRPAAAPAPAPPDALSKFSDTLQQKAMSQGLDNLKSGIQNIVSPPTPDVANMTTPTSAPEGTAPTGMLGGVGGMLGNVGKLFNFANGGIVRGYDDGGTVDDTAAGAQVFDPNMGWMPADDLPNAPVQAGVVPANAAAPAGGFSASGVIAAPTAPAAPSSPAAPANAPIKPKLDSTGQGIPPGYHEENGTLLADAPQGGIVGSSPSAPSSNANPAVASAPQGGVVPPLPPVQWVPPAPKVKSDSQLHGQLIQYASTKDQQYGLPPGTLWGMALPESGGNPDAHNRSGAAGIMQIMPATGASLGVKNPYDPYESIDKAAQLAVQNQAVLRNSLGRDPTAPEIYVAHNQGAAGASKLFLNPNAPATSLLGEAAVVQNGGDPSMTGAQFAQFIEGKFGHGGGSSNSPSDITGSIPAGGVVSPSAATAAGASSSNGVVGAADDGSNTSFFDDLMSGKGLSTNARLALLSAGLAIMGGKSRNPMINIGQGALQGIGAYQQLQGQSRENALAQSEISTRKGQLGLEGKRVDQAAQQLHQEAQQFAQTYGLKANEQQMDRFQAVPTMRGILVRDRLNPQQPGQLVPLTGAAPQGGILGQPQPPNLSGGMMPVSSSDSQDAVSLAAPDSGASQPSGAAPAPVPASLAAGPAASVAAGSAPAGPTVNPNRAGGPPSNAPPTQANAPASSGILSASTPGAAPSGVQRAAVSPASLPKISLQPQAPDASQIPWNGMAFNTEGQKALVDQTSDALKTARGEATAAQAMNQQLQEMQQDIQGLPSNGFLSLGSGFGGRTAFAKTVNSYMQAIHLDPIWDPDQVAKTEDLTKDSTRLGFDLSRMLGSREAGFITNEALAAVPGGANSVKGAQIIMASLQAANQRKVDYYNFIQDWTSKTGGDITGADNYFNTKAPPELYALGAYVPARAMSALRQGQVTPAQFEQKYGAGTSRYVLGAQ